MAKISRALLSVSDKRGIVDLAKVLSEKGIALLSSGGTARTIREAGITVEDVAEVTGAPEMLDGRVKTLHPVIHGGILARRTPDHLDQLEERGIGTIDMVVVNLYPFRETIAKGCALEDAVEQIDIGGPTLIRSAAKNHKNVTVVVDPSDYPLVLEAMGDGRTVPADIMRELAYKAFDHTARYDIAISGYLWKQYHPEEPFPPHLNLTFKREFQTRYGENPHQKGAFYLEEEEYGTCAARAEQLHGKQLSYNNILDLNDALELIKEFPERPTIAEIKHTNPCGIASADSISEAYRLSHSIDPMSAFGGVVAANRPVDEATAEQMKDLFIECVIAPSFTPKALEILTRKKNIRLLGSGNLVPTKPHLEYKRIVGGLLVQDA
ncbi:MAG: bifunctional phosphoribosylaminoimidazolecarboxamide formyltransferase/IMP cyclohydrolase, partial [Thermoplasmata archaeon]|nr:bifunctional phosphoribosylaminoimidazolecarboxamide formyltransferase/IMP cyclohydrolase [Thermoplasmata archaeon]